MTLVGPIPASPAPPKNPSVNDDDDDDDDDEDEDEEEGEVDPNTLDSGPPRPLCSSTNELHIVLFQEIYTKNNTFQCQSPPILQKINSLSFCFLFWTQTLDNLHC